jgi:hypothetical protein
VDQIQYLVLLQVSAAAAALTTATVLAVELEVELDMVLGKLAVLLLPIKVLPEGQMYPAPLLLTIHVVVVVARVVLVVLQSGPLLAPVELA